MICPECGVALPPSATAGYADEAVRLKNRLRRLEKTAQAFLTKVDRGAGLPIGSSEWHDLKRLLSEVGGTNDT